MSFGPVSATLEVELREKVRKDGVVFFVDPKGHYTGFVDDLITRSRAGLWPYPVRAYRGSFLELMLALEHDENGVDKTPLLVHLPGFLPEEMKLTPLYELYEPGQSYRKGLDTLVTEAAAGRVRPEALATFKAADGLTLAAADAWLQSTIDDDGDGFSKRLRHLTITALVDDLLGDVVGGGSVTERLAAVAELAVLHAHFERVVGLPSSWAADLGASSTVARSRAKDAAFRAASWALSVEYTLDLQRPPRDGRLAVAKTLPDAVVQTCRDLARHLRERHADFYERTANETERWLSDETDGVVAADLGQIDTFLFEETAILTASLAALEAGAWSQALVWAELRAEGGSFWSKQAPARLTAWRLVRDAARLGRAIDDAGPALVPAGKTAPSLDDVMMRYVDKGAAVDRAHRHLEQRRLQLYPQVPFFEVLRARIDDVRGRWRTWADRWAIQWNEVCRRDGFLPSVELQQRSLFDTVVVPLSTETGSEVTAFFVVDALRFEMAAELFEALGEVPGTQKHLTARLAELPTVTEVGMNVLAPVMHAVGSRLSPAVKDGEFKGFSAGEFRVFDPKTRQKAMFNRVGGRGCPWLNLEEILQLDAPSLKKKVEQARLLVVHSREIDTAGDTGLGRQVFDKVLQDLRAAWRLLREAGVRRFVITADHGFLLLDDRHGDAQPHGRKADPNRRHAFREGAADHAGEARVALKDLGYVDDEGRGLPGHLHFPETVTVFDTGVRGQNFVHGGNSPQERVIPVLTLVHRTPAGADTHRYEITAEGAEGGDGLQALSATVAVREALFGGRKTLELGLRTIDGPDDVVVELGHVQGGARLADTVIHASVGQPFKVFFRLRGATDERVRVQLHHTGREATVVPASPTMRYAVALVPLAAPEPALTTSSSTTPTTPPTGPTTGTTTGPTTRPTTRPATTLSKLSPLAWAEALPEGGVRQAFLHLAMHGQLVETELVVMVGGQLEARQFARKVDTYAERVPFRVRTEVVGGVKRYVRDGSGPWDS